MKGKHKIQSVLVLLVFLTTFLQVSLHAYENEKDRHDCHSKHQQEQTDTCPQQHDQEDNHCNSCSDCQCCHHQRYFDNNHFRISLLSFKVFEYTMYNEHYQIIMPIEIWNPPKSLKNS